MQYVEARGMRMPKLGLGTWRMKGEECTNAVLGALDRGYRHIDTAQMYGNEDAVGEAIAATSVARNEIHLTTKVWHENLAPDRMQAAMDASLKLLKTSYVDLYLIHWPSANMNLAASLGPLIKFQETGLARHIGVSNFPSAMLREAVEVIQAPLVCNQVEYHVLRDQTAVLGMLGKHGMALTAYCPLAQGRLAEHPVLETIAKKHGATPAQVALKWLLDQHNVAAIPKAARAESQQANLDAMRLTLDDADRAAIAALPKNQRFVAPATGPKWDPDPGAAVT